MTNSLLYTTLVAVERGMAPANKLIANMKQQKRDDITRLLTKPDIINALCQIADRDADIAESLVVSFCTLLPNRSTVADRKRNYLFEMINAHIIRRLVDK